MRALLTLGSLVAIYLPVIISPGPNFLVVTQSAVSQSRRHGVFTALGVASGSTVLAGLAATCMGFLLSHFGHVENMIHILGGGYLLYIGFKIWKQAGVPLSQGAAQHDSRTAFQAYKEGLTTNLTNPKALVFFSTIFATLLAPDAPIWLKLAGVGVISVLSTLWHVVLASLFSHAHIQRTYRKAKGWINRITGGLLSILGLQLLLHA